MSVKKISEAILGVGVDDTTIDLFESQYPVPTGVSYNSYVILDEKTAVLDTVDARATEPWLENLSEALAGRKPDYLVVSHMEPDHGANIAKLAALYPEMQVVGNAKTFLYMDQFFGADAIAKERRVVVKDGESLSLGAHTLTFVFAPMVHWPEVMVSYESTEKVLFSADGFGRFGAVAKFDEKADWASEARRYYLNIVGKYGPQVQALLKKAAALDIQTICPLHGPVLTGDLGKYLNYYDIWSSYKPEEPEKILVASASIHGHTRAAVSYTHLDVYKRQDPLQPQHCGCGHLHLLAGSGPCAGPDVLGRAAAEPPFQSLDGTGCGGWTELSDPHL